MARTVSYSATVLKQIYETVEFLKANASGKAAEKFIDAIEKQEQKLIEYPEIGRKSAQFDDVRFVLVDKYKRLYYRITSSTIMFLTLFDTRQSPNKTPFR